MVADDSFGGWLKQRRKWLDLTQDELAAKAGCSLSTVRRLEQGGLRPSRQLAELLAVALELVPDERPPFVRWARVGGGATEPGTTPAAPVQSTPNGDAPCAGSAEPPNPYKGLRAFQEADTADFFGREALVRRLLERLGEESELSRFLALVGPSGGGKSSLARAGLVPALRQHGLPGGAQPVVMNISPGTHPLEELEAGLLRVAVNPPGSLMEQLRADERGLARAVKRVLPGDEKRELVLVIDQFEELFTLVADERVRADFIDSLFAAISDPRSRLRVIVTLRADFYDRPLAYLPSTELLNRRSELVGPLSSAEMYLAITGPAQRVGLEMESGLISTIMQDIAEQPGSLPLLQYALTELYERREGHILTIHAYRASGGVFGSLARRAESVYAGLTEQEQIAAQQLFLRLVTPREGGEDTRRRVLRSELASVVRDEAALERVLELFGRYRMLTFDRDAVVQKPTVEVAHEALLRTWGRLRGWLDESREQLLMQRRLMSSAAEWHAAGSDSSFLASGTRLTQFAGLVAEAELGAPRPLVLTADEQAYLAASLQEQQQQQAMEQARQRRELALQRRASMRLRYLVAGMAVFLLVAVTLAGWALNRSEAAQVGEQIANTNLARAESLRLAAEANNLLLAHADINLIGLLSIHSLRNQYSPQGDAALSGVAVLGVPPREFTGHTAGLQAVRFSPNGKYLATGSDDKTVRLWDTATGQQLRVFSGHTDGVQSLTFTADGKYIFTTSRDKSARQWDTSTGQEVRHFSGHTDNVTNAVLSPDGKYLLTSSDDGTARLWDMITGETVRIFTNSDGSLSGLAISPDGKYVLAGGAGNTPRLWDLASGKEVRTFVGHTGYVNTLAFSPDGKQMVSGSEDHSVRVWDVATGRPLGLFSGHKDVVRDVAFSPDGKYVLSGSQDETAQLWDVATQQTIHVFYSTGWVINVAFSPDGKYVATASGEKSASLWSMQSTPGEIQLVGHTSAVGQAVFSADGSKLLTASEDDTARLWSAVSGQELVGYGGHSAGLRGASFSPDGKQVVTAGRDGTVVTWDATTGKQLLQFVGHTDLVHRAAFSPDSRYIVTTSYDGTARTWDAQTGKSVVTYRNQGPDHVNRVVFSLDGKTVATSGDDGTARIWDPLTGREIRVFTEHAGIVAGVAFSPDGKNLATAHADGSVRLWDVASGQELRRLAGHPGGVWGVAFSPDGKYVLSSGADQTARLWDGQTGEEVRRFSGHTGAVRSVAFSPDGQYILTASDDHTARLWHTDYHDTIAYVCSLLSRDLTPDERAEYGILDQQPTCPLP
jgi:WD40 repeat protein/transcriptional regulator with XRE-family HTH domain